MESNCATAVKLISESHAPNHPIIAIIRQVFDWVSRDWQVKIICIPTEIIPGISLRHENGMGM